MTKYFGKIGFAKTSEIKPGVWQPIITEREYYGDILDGTTLNYESPDKVNDDISLKNRISIVADKYLLDNFQMIKYAELMGAKWRVSSVSIQYPRLILTIGGVYNGE